MRASAAPPEHNDDVERNQNAENRRRLTMISPFLLSPTISCVAPDGSLHCSGFAASPRITKPFTNWRSEAGRSGPLPAAPLAVDLVVFRFCLLIPANVDSRAVAVKAAVEAQPPQHEFAPGFHNFVRLFRHGMIEGMALGLRRRALAGNADAAAPEQIFDEEPCLVVG
jgi:hypothetical protein